MVYLLFVLAARWAWTSIIQQENVLSHRSDMVRHNVIQTKVIEVELYVNLSRIYHKKGPILNRAFKVLKYESFRSIIPTLPMFDFDNWKIGEELLNRAGRGTRWSSIPEKQREKLQR